VEGIVKELQKKNIDPYV